MHVLSKAYWYMSLVPEWDLSISIPIEGKKMFALRRFYVINLLPLFSGYLLSMLSIDFVLHFDFSLLGGLKMLKFISRNSHVTDSYYDVNS